MSQGSLMGTFTADGNSDEIAVGGRATVKVGDSDGNSFGSGTVSLQVKTPEGWAASGTSYTEEDVDAINLGGPAILRLVMSGSTTPDVNYAITQ